MSASFINGAIIGASLAVVVAIIGLVFFRKSQGEWVPISESFKQYFRRVLAVISVLGAAIGWAVAVRMGSVSALEYYEGALSGYAGGLALYFFLRYAIFKIR